MGFIYLASPYSHADANVREMRFRAVAQAAALLMKAGNVVFSPIAHSHSIETIAMNHPENGDFWKHQDIPILRHASRLVVLMLDGWDRSAGIRWEVDTAHALFIPVEYLKPGEVTM